MKKKTKQADAKEIWKEMSLMISLFLVIIAYISFVVISRQKEVIEIQTRNIEHLGNRIENLEDGKGGGNKGN